MGEVTVELNGPVFTGAAQAQVTAFMHDAVKEVTKVGRGDIGIQFIKVFQHPTGFYESRVRAYMRDPLHGVVDGATVAYAWWLEGVGSRNYPVTRFKGYRSFALVTAELELKAGRIAETQLPPHLARMNGRP